jgi:serine protease Do
VNFARAKWPSPAMTIIVASALVLASLALSFAGASEAVFCPVCGARNPAGSRFCQEDGTPLPDLADGTYSTPFTQDPETVSAEEAQRYLRAASASVVRIRIKVKDPLRFPIAESDSDQGYSLTRTSISRHVNFGRLVTLDDASYAGSGFVISATGEVVTNAHVASPFGASGAITVETRDGRSFPARLVGVDRASDLALLSVAGSGLPPLEWGDSSRVRLGAITWAIGNPLDIGLSVTRGTNASVAGVRAGINQIESYLHSDAYITHGNSGGPLVDVFGKVIGISDIGLGSAKGNGYSIASNLAGRVVERLRKNGRYDRGFLGMHVSPVDASSIKRLGLKAQRGVVVESVLPGSPAAAAGFARGDVLFGINGRLAVSSYQFQEAIGSVGAGIGLTITLDRGGERHDLKVTTVLRPDEPRIDPITALENWMFVRFEEDPKARRVVLRVPYAYSPAPAHGFLEGSIIESVVPAQDWNDQPLTVFDYKRKARPMPVAGLDDLRKALQRAYLGQRVGVAFEMRRSQDPIVAVAFDELWPIVI